MKFSPLDAQHRLLDAKMTPFGGWDMPLAYPSGTLAEHASCRTSCAMFDVSHLGTVRVEGADAFASLQKNLTNDLTRVSPGRAQYTHLLDEVDGSVLDDIIIWWVSEDVFDVMPNASNTDRVVSAIGGVDTTETRAVIALQGPTARSVVAAVSPEAAAVPRFRVAVVEIAGVICTVAGTRYTGEEGLEIAVPSAHAPTIWNALLAAGAMPAGLGARDTLRLEAALPLHGHELGAGITSFVGVVCRDGDTTGACAGATTSFSCAGCVAVFEGSGVFVVTGFVTGAGVITKSIPFFLFSNAITEYCAKS